MLTRITRLNGKSFIKDVLRFCTSEAKKPAIILGIETSCDDTGIGIVNSEGTILANSIHSQENLHLRYGGIIPYMAEDLHNAKITEVCENALKTANIKLRDVDAIATTIKPGLALSLNVGIQFGKYLSKIADKPFIPIHHMKAHALTVRISEKVEFPYLVLLMSGGHSLLGIVENVEQFYLLGSTHDDAAGEAMDKLARRLKLHNIPEFANLCGGAALEAAAAKATESDKYQINVPLRTYRDCNFSFSGVKNMVKFIIQQEEKENNIEGDNLIPNVYNLSAAIQNVITKHLCHRTVRAMQFVNSEEIKEHFGKEINTLVISGGVASNNFIAKTVDRICSENNFKFVRTPPHLCKDNGVMIAWNGVEKYLINSEVLTNREEIESIDLERKCPLGIDWTNKVMEMNIKTKSISL